MIYTVSINGDGKKGQRLVSRVLSGPGDGSRIADNIENTVLNSLRDSSVFSIYESEVL